MEKSYKVQLIHHPEFVREGAIFSGKWQGQTEFFEVKKSPRPIIFFREKSPRPINFFQKKSPRPIHFFRKKMPRPINFFREISPCPINFFRKKSHCPIKFFQVKSTCPIIRSLNITISSIQKSHCPIIPTCQKTICPINIPTNHQTCSKLLVEVYWCWFSSEDGVSLILQYPWRHIRMVTLLIILSRVLELRMFSS